MLHKNRRLFCAQGTRLTDNHPIILKVLKEDYPTPEKLIQFRQEYEITRVLKMSGVINTYGQEKYDNTLAIILEDFGGQSLKILYKQHPFSIAETLKLATLALIHEKSPAETAGDLWPAMELNMLLPLRDEYKIAALEPIDIPLLEEETRFVYKFTHDRIAEAAYNLIPEHERQVLHLKVGRLLLGKSSGGPSPGLIFDLVDHLNMGQELIEDQAERDGLARLNLQAGSIAAYFSAPELMALLIFQKIKISMKYGTLAMGLMETKKFNKFRAKTVLIFNYWLRHWKTPLRKSLPPLLEAHKIALEMGHSRPHESAAPGAPGGGGRSTHIKPTQQGPGTL